MKSNIRFQPLVNLSDDRVFGYEALCNKGNAVEYPSASSILNSISSSCKYSRSFKLFINMTVSDVVNCHFCTSFLKALDKMEIDGRQIVLEVNENTHPNSINEAKKTLSLLRRHNIKIALDDFGVQYASVSYMHELPLDIIKIDQKLIQKTPTSKKARSLLKAVVDMSHDIGCDVVAEGIETIDQLDCAKESEADIGQGFLFSPSLPFPERKPFISLREFATYLAGDAESLGYCYC